MALVSVTQALPSIHVHTSADTHNCMNSADEEMIGVPPQMLTKPSQTALTMATLHWC